MEPKTRISSIKHTTPSRPERIRDILFWKCSGALDIPNGSLLKQYLPKGVMNVVSNCDSSASGICQKPQFASSLLKILPLSVAPVCRQLEEVGGLRSTYTLIAPSFLGATTIAAHQGVGFLHLSDNPHPLHVLKLSLHFWEEWNWDVAGSERERGSRRIV